MKILAEDLSLEEKKKKRRERGIRTPPTGAGLLRFYEEESGPFAISPVSVVLIATIFVATIIILWILS